MPFFNPETLEKSCASLHCPSQIFVKKTHVIFSISKTTVNSNLFQIENTEGRKNIAYNQIEDLYLPENPFFNEKRFFQEDLTQLRILK